MPRLFSNGVKEMRAMRCARRNRIVLVGRSGSVRGKGAQRSGHGKDRL